MAPCMAPSVLVPKLCSFAARHSLSLKPCPKEALATARLYAIFGGVALSHDIRVDPGGTVKDGTIALVQGASKGLGLEFVRQLLQKDPKNEVIATCRSPHEATELETLKHQHSHQLSVLPLDVTLTSTIEAVAKFVAARYGRLNLLINCAGILQIPGLLQPETSLSKIEQSALLLSYEVNAVGPILVIKHLWPFLKAGGSEGSRKSVVANLSARVGSISDNKAGGWHSYRASKAALNQLTKTVSLEFAQRKDPIICILLHPGTVDTDLSKPFQRNILPGKLFTPEYSVKRLLCIIDDVQMKDNGKFFAWDGHEIEW